MSSDLRRRLVAIERKTTPPARAEVRAETRTWREILRSSPEDWRRALMATTADTASVPADRMHNDKRPYRYQRGSP